MSNDNINFVRIKHTGKTWYWTAVANNGEPIATGGGHNTEAAVRESVRLNYGDVEVRVVE